MSPGEDLANAIGSMLTWGERAVFGLAQAANALFMGAKIFGSTNPLTQAAAVLSGAAGAQLLDAYAISRATGITLAQAQDLVSVLGGTVKDWAGFAYGLNPINREAILSALIYTDVEDIVQGAAMHAAMQRETQRAQEMAEWDAAQVAMQTTATTGYEPSSWESGYSAGWESGTSGEGFGDGAGGGGGYGMGGGESAEGAGASGGYYQHGGIIPGPIGKPQRIIAHGGERVQTREQQAAGATINLYFRDVYGPGGIDQAARELVSAIRRLGVRLPGVNLIPVRA